MAADMKSLRHLIPLLAVLASTPVLAADKEVKLFLLAGQSNMDGCGIWEDLPVELRKTPGNVRIWDNRDSKWVELGRDSTAIARNLQFGPEIAFAHGLSKAYPDHEIALVKTSAGGTKLHTQWTPGKGMYERFTGNYQNAVADLKKAGKKCEIAGMLWMQGESDSETLEMANAYEANLKAMFRDVREKVGKPHLPIVMGRISSSLLKKTPWNFDHAAVVQKAQEAVATADPDVSIIHTDELGTLNDNTHFDSKAQLTLGGEMATRMLGLLEKRKP
jgi:Carbohydrate esterase, sialic acid-specific acetylesterase